MGFKDKGILYGMQRQPGHPFLVNHLIGALAWVLKPLAERLTVDSGIARRPSERIVHSLWTLLPATSFQSEWFVLRAP